MGFLKRRFYLIAIIAIFLVSFASGQECSIDSDCGTNPFCMDLAGQAGSKYVLPFCSAEQMCIDIGDSPIDSIPNGMSEVGTDDDKDDWDEECSDCDDSDKDVYPGAPEVCDGADNDCSGSTADGADETWFGDACDGADADLCEEGTFACDAGSQACTDTTPDNVEACNGLDDDCDGNVPAVEVDSDGDSYRSCSATPDCMEGNPDIYPGAPEIECNSVDEDCDGSDTCGCEPDWVPGPWSACGTDDLQTASFIDANDCGDPSGKPDDITQACDYCTPSWTCDELSCQSDDTMSCSAVTDSNGCFALTGLDSDTYTGDYSEFSTQTCDFDGNGVIGDLDSADSNFGLGITIDGSADLSLEFTGVLHVVLLDGSDPVGEFDYDFSAALDLNNLVVKKGTGYVLVSGVNPSGTKTLYLASTTNDTTLCIKDAEVSEISSVSSSCNQANEYIIACPGSSSGYSCSISSGTYTITGLQNSAVKEYDPSAPPCVESWTCSAWGTCGSTGKQSRKCTDANACGTTANQPNLKQSCHYSGGGGGGGGSGSSSKKTSAPPIPVKKTTTAAAVPNKTDTTQAAAAPAVEEMMLPEHPQEVATVQLPVAEEKVTVVEVNEAPAPSFWQRLADPFRHLFTAGDKITGGVVSTQAKKVEESTYVVIVFCLVLTGIYFYRSSQEKKIEGSL
jgi:hypothetical protein